MMDYERDVYGFVCGSTSFERTACCFDGGEGNSLSIVGSNGGDIAVYKGGRWRVLEAAHILGVNYVGLFPSGKVLLSGGTDTKAKIWCLEEQGHEDEADDIYEAATLQGTHVSGVVAATFIGVGRQVVTSARDGGIALWDVPSQACVTMLSPADPLRGETCTSMLVEDGSIVLCARTSSTVTVHDTRTAATPVRTFGVDPSLGGFTAISKVDDFVAVGSELGFLSLFDWRTGVLSKASARKNDARISALNCGIVGNTLGQAWKLNDEAMTLINPGLLGDPVIGVASEGRQICTTSKIHLKE